MVNPQFVLIPCRACSATTLVLVDKRRPRMCARCRAPYDPEAGAFVRAADADRPAGKRRSGAQT